MATQDARGQISLAYAVPRQALTRDQWRLFLYPVPPPGKLLTNLEETGIEPALLLAMARCESLFEPAERSRAGALGWLQIMPFNYPNRGFTGQEVIWNRPVTSLQTGARLLAENLDRYAGDPYRSVAAYNAGAKAVDRWLRQLGGQLPNDLFLTWIGYSETRHYTEKVLIEREIYDWILEEELKLSP
jgi:soluble lytic murein transglycosylase